MMNGMRLRHAFVAALLALALLSPASPGASVAGFGDVEDARYFTAPVQWMVDEGITNGTSPTTFAPGQAVTRVQFAAFLSRYDNLTS